MITKTLKLFIFIFTGYALKYRKMKKYALKIKNFLENICYFIRCPAKRLCSLPSNRSYDAEENQIFKNMQSWQHSNPKSITER